MLYISLVMKNVMFTASCKTLATIKNKANFTALVMHHCNKTNFC